ncbi:hypothetical protein QR695_13610, partial [Exiguobacterium mexicanum]
FQKILIIEKYHVTLRQILTNGGAGNDENPCATRPTDYYSTEGLKIDSMTETNFWALVSMVSDEALMV